MIQESELRIGNHIWNGVITEVRKDGFKFYDGYSEWDSIKMIQSCIKPYKFTTKELKKCGFKKCDTLGKRILYRHNKFNDIMAEPTDDSILIYFKGELLCCCEYVHRLQNLIFSLMGQEIKCKL